jgi:hypothetical protein
MKGKKRATLRLSFEMLQKIIEDKFDLHVAENGKNRRIHPEEIIGVEVNRIRDIICIGYSGEDLPVILEGGEPVEMKVTLKRRENE